MTPSLSLVFSSGCGSDQPIVAPPPAFLLAPAGPTFTLSGTITDSTSGQPLTGADLAVEPLHFPRFLSWSWPPPAGLTYERPTNDAGHYSVSGLPDWTGTAVLAVVKSGYLQQCAAMVTLQSNATPDVQLVPAERVVVASARAGVTPGTRTVMGGVYEVTPAGRRPVENAWVGWESQLDFTAAQTRSDQAGRYLLCGLPMEPITDLFAEKNGSANATYVSVDAGGDAMVDIEIEGK